MTNFTSQIEIFIVSIAGKERSKYMKCSRRGVLQFVSVLH